MVGSSLLQQMHAPGSSVCDSGIRSWQLAQICGSEEGGWHEALGIPVVAEPAAAVAHRVLLLDDPQQVARRDPDLELVGGDEVVGGLVELRRRVTTSQESSLPRGLRRLGGWRERHNQCQMVEL